MTHPPYPKTDAPDAPPAYQEYRAPQRHGTALTVPRLDQAASLLSDNQALLAALPSDWKALQREARSQLIDAARRYTSTYRSVETLGANIDAPIVMAGHQPAIFHPGVWFKNFALDHIARQTGSTAINLVVDNDVAAASAIRVPTRGAANGQIHYHSVAFDAASGGVPYEQTLVTDRDRFDRFDEAVVKVVRPLVADPCITELWHHARAAVRRCGYAGCAMAQARHAYENDLGLQTLEIPIGVLCRSIPFAKFALGILRDLPRFHEIYNRCTDLYRAAHGIRSNAHPVPNLQQDDEWLEAPFWLYGNLSPQRRGVWVRYDRAADTLHVSDRNKRLVKIQRPDSDAAAEQLFAAMTQEFKLRSRALVTTMYARLILSDLFLHGIGGGKYDQLGDQIMSQFFALQPPRFMVMSATVQLPGAALQHQPDVEHQIRQLRDQIRQTRFQGQCFAETGAVSSDLVTAKQALLSDIPERGVKLAWHKQVTAVNAAMSAQLADVRAELNRQLEAARERSLSQAILRSREHPFCIFPIDWLVQTYRGILSGSSTADKNLADQQPNGGEEQTQGGM
ncbi:hypothetical protein [Stieleria varia]|uniref:Uncharacterized protein n=1 Tax=Stieleria varia TaxID=2528005 RepID=A0A5C6B7I5_9BACT|nr:hypothetical protein [Stieleria varia]TWU07900.1 hypothetical protein Pla52n_04770 [Stieleria varia]